MEVSNQFEGFPPGCRFTGEKESLKPKTKPDIQTAPMTKLTTLLAAAILGLAGVAHAVDEKTTYPLTTCIVSGEGLDEMGKPYVFTYEGQEIQLCCKGCKKKFDKDPAKYMKILDAAKASDSTATNAAGDDDSGRKY